MNTKSKRILIIILFLILMLFLCLLLIYLYKYKSSLESVKQNQIGIVSPNQEKPTLENTLEKYEIEYLEQEGTKIYVKFPKDLYDENGKSNQSYFLDVIEAIKPFFENTSFSLLDNDKKIEINIYYDAQRKNYKIVFNGDENFFENIDGDTYALVEKVSVVDSIHMNLTFYEFQMLKNNRMNISTLTNYLGEGTLLDNGYMSYFDGKVKIKLNEYGQVINIRLSDDYEGEIAPNIHTKTKLKEIQESYPDVGFGSLKDGVLGYKTANAYVFYYEDEISIYSHQYTYNKEFEQALQTYIENQDFKMFANYMNASWYYFDEFTIDIENESAHVTRPNMGIEINIQNNDSKGVILYNNYYLTDETKRLAKEGKITLIDKDYIYEYEMNQRKSL